MKASLKTQNSPWKSLVLNGARRLKLILRILFVQRQLPLMLLGRGQVRLASFTRGRCSSVFQSCNLNGFCPAMRVNREPFLQCQIPLYLTLTMCSSMVPVAPFYLGAESASASTPAFRPQSMSQANILAKQSPTSPTSGNRMSMPAASAARSSPATDSPKTPNSPFVNQSSATPVSQQPETVPEAQEESNVDGGEDEERSPRSRSSSGDDKSRKRRSGTMNRDFKFPATPSPNGSPVVPPPVPTIAVTQVR